MIHNSRFFFSSDLFFSGLFFEILFPETLLPIGSPHTILGKKSPRNPKHRTLFPLTFFSKDLIKFGLFFQSFYFQVFFQKLFFPGLSNVDSGDREQFLSNLLIHMFIGTPCTIYIYPVSYSKYHV